MAAIVKGLLVVTTMLNSKLDELCNKASVPLPIAELEAVEAELKAPWIKPISEGLSSEQVNEFVSYFAKVGFLPKYKSYGTKYAAPFGYSLFDLKDNAGFSVQLHEEAKIEAFHILGVQTTSFLLLGSIQEWEKTEQDFLDNWAKGTPENSPMVHRVRPGDVALVSSLSMVHTVVGCILEEYATTSYDVVTRLHDQNKDDQVVLPTEILPVAEVLRRANTLEPQRLVTNTETGWETTEIINKKNIVSLSSDGLTGRHQQIGNDPETISADENSIATIVALNGDVMLEVDGYQQVIAEGGTTALPPSTVAQVSNASQFEKARVAVCTVAKHTALADLRSASRLGM